MLNLRTDNKWHDFKYRNEVPAKVLKSEFDYQDKSVSDMYFKYKNSWHHADQFMRTDEPKGWDGILNLSFSSGLLLKISPDGERYKVAYYWATSE